MVGNRWRADAVGEVMELPKRRGVVGMAPVPGGSRAACPDQTEAINIEMFVRTPDRPRGCMYLVVQ
jgi:hypothetical protein